MLSYELLDKNDSYIETLLSLWFYNKAMMKAVRKYSVYYNIYIYRRLMESLIKSLSIIVFE
jgi:hypothetical protein